MCPSTKATPRGSPSTLSITSRGCSCQVTPAANATWHHTPSVQEQKRHRLRMWNPRTGKREEWHVGKRKSARRDQRARGCAWRVRGMQCQDPTSARQGTLSLARSELVKTLIGTGDVRPSSVQPAPVKHQIGGKCEHTLTTPAKSCLLSRCGLICAIQRRNTSHKLSERNDRLEGLSQKPPSVATLHLTVLFIRLLVVIVLNHVNVPVTGGSASQR